MPEGIVNYTPVPSLVPFLTSSKFVTIQVGPIGCVSCDTEFLTPTGWKRIDQYNDGDLVAQWDSFTEQAEFVKPTAYIKLPCDKFYHFHHREGLSQVLSEEHRVVYKLRRKKPVWHERTAKEIAEWHWRNGADMVRIPVTFKAPKASGMPYTDDELRLAVAICADGTICHTGAVAVNLKKQYKKDRIVELLKRLGIEYSVHKSAPGYDRYYFRHKIQDKEFGSAWWAANEHQLGVIADELPRWDGGATVKGLSIYRSTNKASADFAQYCFVVAGKKTSLNVGKGGCWQVLVSNRDAKYVGVAGTRKGTHEKSNNCDIVPSSDGYKYCFSVPSSYLILRHNNCVFVTGNSGKTTASLFRLVYLASKMAPCADGVRRSRYCIVRNTYQQISDTILRDFLSWFPDGVAGTYKKTERIFTLEFDCGDGTRVWSECLFRSLEDKDDVRRLLSLQLSGALVDEVREIDPDVFAQLQGRCGRYPSKAQVKPNPEKWGLDSHGNPIGGCVQDDGTSNAMVWSATNPPAKDSWWGKFLLNPPENAAVFFQPSGLSPECDFRKYLPGDYYENLVASHDEDWVDCYVHGHLSKSLAGTPVYKSFSADMHVSKHDIAYNRNHSSITVIGCDCALHPAAVWTQLTYDGRLMVLHEEFASGMGALNFLREKVRPVQVQLFNNHPCVLVVDPSANTRAATDERTWLDIARSLGFEIVCAPTNSTQARISAVDAFLTKLVDGKPGMLIDPSCKNLIEGFEDTYQYESKRDGDMHEVPTKSHINGVSDLHDALQYAALYCDKSGIVVKKKHGLLPVKKAKWVYV